MHHNPMMDKEINPFQQVYIKINLQTGAAVWRGLPGVDRRL
jgi:hypothetical protein